MRVDVAIADTITLTNSGINGARATQVGDPPVWEDDSDATYVELDGAYFGPGQPVFRSIADVNINTQTLTGLNPDNPDFKCFLSMRLNGVQPGLDFPFVQIEAAGGTAQLNPASTPACPDSPEWVDLELSGPISDFWEVPGTYALRVRAPSMVIGDGDLEIRSWRFYEVRVYFEIPTRELHPLMHYPRADGLAVGSGRQHFPRPNTKQYSNSHFPATL